MKCNITIFQIVVFMENEVKNSYSKLQFSVLVLLRFLVGWHLLYEGLAKYLSPNWTSKGFLRESQWIMSGVADWIISNSTVLSIVDFLNVCGLIAIGISLIIGLFARPAAIFGAVLLFIYYLNNAPITGIEYSVPTEGNYLVVSKTLIEAVALVLLAVFSTSDVVGLDSLVYKWKNKK
jgi:thiosulfate dehydrogenase (quinone) large subunit